MEPGTKVSWTKPSTSGSVLTLRQYYGTVVTIDGDDAVVDRNMTRGKLRERVKLFRLRTEGQETQITELIEALKGKGGQ